LHIGGARTALFCWLLARNTGGKMILRIEDTDQKRNTPTAMQQVMDDLRWLGIQWDEGPEVGGPAGPYLQSQRLDIYNQYAKKLLDSGHAYYCFDTPEELEVLREKATAEKKAFVYPRPAVFPDDRAVAAARAQGRPVTIRFVVPESEPILVQDIVRGEVTFAPGEIGDFIIIKSDGFPTYHFACVVDDELMGVTHILRGQEHLMNTPGHLALQRALGFRTPTYAHMSVTVSEGGGKLSKRERGKVLRDAIQKTPNADLDLLAKAGNISRQELDSFLAKSSELDGSVVSAIAGKMGIHLPEINVVDFRQSGYIPETLVNFIALLGWNPGDNREIMPLQELIEAFDLNRLCKTNSLFDRKKLVAFNTEHMRMVAPEKLLAYFKDYLSINHHPAAALDDSVLAHLLKVSQGARTLEDIAQKALFLVVDKVTFDPAAVQKVLKKDGADHLLKLTRDVLASLPIWSEESLHKAIEDLCTAHQVGMGKVAQPIRVAITGTTVSPPIGDSLMLLGKQKTIQRIEDTLEYLKS